MSKENKKEESGKKFTELRQDLVTGDWVVIAANRARRPEEFIVHDDCEVEVSSDPEKKCFFCYPEETGQEKDVLIYTDANNDWTLRVFPNKYPAFVRGGEISHKEEGPYFMMDGVGYHELVVTRDHKKSIALLDKESVAEVLDAYQDRYIDLMNKKSVNYIEIFHNHKKSAGASIPHPHSQLVAIPVVSPYIKAELDGAEEYHRMNKHCAYCAMAEWEMESGKRVVFENDKFIAFCPFASRAAFEIWVMPKKHNPYFERMSAEDKLEAAEALQVSLAKIYDALGNPAYNFYLHTAPCDGKDYPHFHWHIEILPRTALWAGFELSTGIEISTIEPETAAEYLRNTKV